jgi:hypothetical protein
MLPVVEAGKHSSEGIIDRVTDPLGHEEGIGFEILQYINWQPQ